MLKRSSFVRIKVITLTAIRNINNKDSKNNRKIIVYRNMPGILKK
jgi:hypothetical protein